MRHDNASRYHRLLDVAKAERKVEVQPEAVGDNFRREAKPFVIGSIVFVFMKLS